MTPRQIYRELVKLSLIRGSDGKPLVTTRKMGAAELKRLSTAFMALVEKLDSERASMDFRYYYQGRPRDTQPHHSEYGRAFTTRFIDEDSQRETFNLPPTPLTRVGTNG